MSLPYTLTELKWDQNHVQNESNIYCYCGGPREESEGMLQCKECKQWFHSRCIKSVIKPLLLEDRFNIFICSICQPSGTEFYQRRPMSWIQVIHLCLFNLMILNPEKKFFRWREDICALIEDYWDVLRPNKEKKQSWCNTVASVLSVNQRVFLSGFEVFKQNGWWSLQKLEPPLYVGTRSWALSPTSTTPPSETANNDIFEEKEELMICELIRRAEFVQPNLHRLNRKLRLGLHKRKLGMQLFNFDNKVQEYLSTSKPLFIPVTEEKFKIKLDKSFEYSLMGNPFPLVALNEYPQTIISPYSYKPLAPFIWRDFDCTSNYLSILRSIAPELPKYPVDYMNIRAEQIPQINRILSHFFWPNIEMSESLTYPEFGIVVCYKKLIVGCAFTTPDGYITYFFVHPLFQKSGVGSKLLYFLIQACPDYDMTLHVAATNEAMILYQKFGFKPESFIVQFYNQYYPDSAIACKNAMFMRLRR